MRICLNAGHGGSDPGAVGPTGLTEAEMCLRMCDMIGIGLLEDDHLIWHTRQSDVFVSLEDICTEASKYNADLLLSIHCNAFSNENAHGYEVWTSKGQTAADPIAELLFESIGNGFPNLAPRFDKTDGDSDKEAGFKVLTGVACPAVLVEVAFISNPLEENWLRDTGWRMRMAGSIVSGIRRVGG